MTWWIWIFVALFGLFAFWQAEQPDCSASPGGTEECPARRVDAATVVAAPRGGWEEVTTGEIRGVILPARDADSLVDGTFPDLGDDDYWTPTAMDVEAAEAVIATEQGELDHIRQYAGFIENGERKVFVNGFSDTFDADWTTEPVLVDDGGDRFFTAVYNVESGELEKFRFNGQA